MRVELKVRLVHASTWVMVVVLAAAAAWAQPPAGPRIRETTPARRVADDPAVNPKSTAPPPRIPARALVDDGPVEPEERREGWAVARWTVHRLQVPANAKRTISVPAPSVLLIRASWPDTADVTITVTRGGTSLATIKAGSPAAGGRLATARVNVPSPGEVVIAASGAASTRVTLHTGVLPAR